MALRYTCGCVVLSCIAVGAARFAPNATVLAAEAPSASPVLNLRLTVSDELPVGSRGALTSEAETIWRRGHIRLRWLAGGAEPDTGPTLRVLVTPRSVTSVDGPRWPVGELLRFDGTSAIAIASITGAQRIVEESRRYRLIDLPELHEHRLGVVLGRAVAHEIGHFLLKTNTHATEGLMRASIDAREFADLRAGTFRLDEAAVAHMAAIAARSAVPDLSVAESFSYSALR
jgi:hypothetical protein